MKDEKKLIEIVVEPVASKVVLLGDLKIDHAYQYRDGDRKTVHMKLASGLAVDTNGSFMYGSTLAGWLSLACSVEDLGPAKLTRENGVAEISYSRVDTVDSLNEIPLFSVFTWGTCQENFVKLDGLCISLKGGSTLRSHPNGKITVLGKARFVEPKP